MNVVLAGCRTCRILLAGHRLFGRTSSTSVTSSNLDWREPFEDYFGKSLPSKLAGNQPAGSTALLFRTSRKSEHIKAVRKRPSQVELSEEELQLLEDLGPSEVFKNLIDELSVDHAVLLCTKLPDNHLNMGLNTLLKILLERVQEKDVDATDHGVLADKILDLLEQIKSRNCTLSEGTEQTLRKWLQNCMHAVSCNNVWKLLYQESMTLSGAKNLERALITQCCNVTEEIDTTWKTEVKDTTLSGRGSSSFLQKDEFTDLHCKTTLRTSFYSYGKSAYKGKGKEVLLQLQELQQKGMPEEDLGQLINSFTKGLTEVHPNSRDVRRSIETFKSIIRTIKLNSTSSFNLLIANCANHGEIDVCIDLIQTMKAIGLQPCASSYEPLIKYFARTLEISKAEDILRVMKESGMHASVKAHASLIIAHAKTSNFEKAYNLIEGIPCKNLTADLYTPIIHAYGLKGNVPVALSVFHQMKRRNVNPNGENFASLIRACAYGKNFKGAEQVFKLYNKQGKFSKEEQKGVVAAMLRVYASCGDSNRLEKMMSSTNIDVLVTPEVKSALLKGFAETGRAEEAFQVFKEIRNGGSWPDSGAFFSLLWSLGNAGKIDDVLALFEPFRKFVQTRSRVQQEEMMSIACCSIVHCLISHNNLEGALTFLQRIQLEDAGDVETLCLKVFMEDKANLEITQRVHLPLKDKLHFLQAMRETLKIQPTRLAYESLLESCAKEKDAYHAEAILGLMRSDHLELNVFTYLIMLRILICRGDFERAKMLTTEMRETMKSNGLNDQHVKFVIMQILQSGNDSLLVSTLYSS